MMEEAKGQRYYYSHTAGMNNIVSSLRYWLLEIAIVCLFVLLLLLDCLVEWCII